MGFRRQTPEGGQTRDRWAFVSTESGKPWDAWIAGPVEWFKCHRDPQSKPCAFEFTQGELKCALCKAGWVPYWWGYLPVYRCLDGKAALVGVHEDTFDLFSRLARLDHVRLLRGPAVTDGVGVLPTGGARYKVFRPDRMLPPDLLPHLLRLWNRPELSAWWGGLQSSSKNDPPAAPPCDSSSASVTGDQADGGAPDSPELRERWRRAVAESQSVGRRGLPPRLGDHLNGSG